MKKIDKKILIFPKVEKTFIELQSIEDENAILINNFFNCIEDEIKNKNELITLDMQNLKTINSYILARLLYYQKRAKKFNCKIKIINLNENIRKILFNLKFNDFFIFE